MKTSNKYLFAALGLGLLGACSEDRLHDAFQRDTDHLPITLSAAYPTVTRASDAGFEDGDKMGVYVLDYYGDRPQGIYDDDVHASNVNFCFNEADNSWNSSTGLYWTSKDMPADIIGYYPYVSDMQDAKSYSFSIRRRQDATGTESAMSGYEASDFLWAKVQKAMPTDSRVDLTFSHKMAGVRVTLSEGKGFASGEWAALDKSVLIPNIKSSADIDLETGTVGSAYGDVISVSSYRNGEDWRAVVVPQTISAGENVIDITVDGVSYHLTKTEAFSYIGGKLSSFTVTVNKREDSNGFEFKLTDEAITAWIDDVEFRDGMVRNYLTIDVEKKGSLQNIIENQNLSLSSITNLKLIGEINEDDFQFLREECSHLRSLNLYEAVCWDGDRQYVIPEGAMKEKATLSHIVFPKNVKVIGTSAFFKTSLLGSLILPDGLEKIGEREFELHDVEGYVDTDNTGAFAYCSSLYGELYIPSTVAYIESFAFSKCAFTGQLNLPEGLKLIGNFAFEHNGFSGVLSIPEDLEILGAGAFRDNCFVGDLVIPDNFKTIYACTFKNAGFSGVLSLPAGLREINQQAFLGCGFRGELKLPAKLKSIGERAFAATKIGSIVFPEKIVNLGAGAFKDCLNLRGSVEIPKSVLRINSFLFANCPQISELVLHEDLLAVHGGFLYGCSGLNRLVCHATQPPLLRKSEDYMIYESWSLPGADWGLSDVDPFDGMALDNFTLEVPKESLDLYKRADGWKEFRRISEYSNFVCRPSQACALNLKHTETLVINSDGEWEVIEKPEWCTLSKSSGNLKTEITLTINNLSKGSSDRVGKVVFRLKDTDITTECAVCQYDYLYEENECITLQKASKGNGINVLFVGDGWDASSIADGSYLNLVNEQMEAFFGIEPYMSYRDRFNVYACVALSQDRGINTSSSYLNTRFGALYGIDWDGSGKLALEDEDAVFDYAVSNSPLKKEEIPQSLIIMPLNSRDYGSATILTETGSCIAMCCSSPDSYPMDTRGIIQHEACGHAFGKLAEERITSNSYVSEKIRNQITECHWRGWYHNISLTGKMSEVHWSDLIFDSRYSDKVDIFEGGYGFTRGVYRAEINSCMNYGIPYFSAPARLDIMRRILEYSGEGFTMEKFYATDSDRWGSTGATRAAVPDASGAYVNSGMHHPVRIVKSKKY